MSPLSRLLALVLALTVAFPAVADDKESRPVIAAAVSPLQGDYRQLAGIVAPRTTVTLGFSVSGRLVSRDVSVGDIVAPGDVLARLDAIAVTLKVDEASAQLRSAEADLESARSLAERQRQLNERQSASDTALEIANLRYQTAIARARSAAASLAVAQDLLDKTALRADFAGVVTAVAGEVGEVVAPGAAVVTLADPATRDAIVDVPEVLMQSLAVGDAWTLMLEVDPAIQAQGSIRELSPQADPLTRTHRMRISIEAAPPAFRFGTTVFAQPKADLSGDLLTLPTSALLEADGGTWVWVVSRSDHKVSRRAVEVTVFGHMALVARGLAAGEIVVTAGVHSLTQDQIVRLPEALLQ